MSLLRKEWPFYQPPALGFSLGRRFFILTSWDGIRIPRGEGEAAAVVFLQVIRLQGFSWYDFASFDDSSSAKLGHGDKSIRQKKEHVFATSRCSSWRRPER